MPRSVGGDEATRQATSQRAAQERTVNVEAMCLFFSDHGGHGADGRIRRAGELLRAEDGGDRFAHGSLPRTAHREIHEIARHLDVAPELGSARCDGPPA